MYSTFDLHQSQLKNCSNPSCGKHPAEDAKPFQKRSACGLAAYCSSECQRTAWTMPTCPHKQFCKLAQRLKVGWAPILGRSIAPIDMGEQILEEILERNDPSFGEKERKAFLETSNTLLEMRPFSGEMSYLERLRKRLPRS